MFTVQSYVLAVAMCFVTMLCWGSWANTQKLAAKEWRFQLFYWDYAIGVLIWSLLLAFTLGSTGSAGRSFLNDISQAGRSSVCSALLGGAIFNVANILLVAAIDIAGMAVAFPIGIGLALALGVITNYIAVPVGNPVLLFLGVGGIVIAIITDALAYKKLSAQGNSVGLKGFVISILSGIFMGIFYRFVAASMSTDFVNPAAGKLCPYAAIVVFSIGLFLSNFILNSTVMLRPFVGAPIPFGDYFTKGTAKLHLVGILGGIIWNVGMSFSIVASGAAGFAISYGLGQGATMIAAFWGVFIWREFKTAPAGTNKLLAIMFVFYLVGLVLIIASKLV